MSKLTEHKFSKHKEEVIEKFELMLQGEELPEVYKTKKFSQSVFPKKWDDLPTATILSMPDDFIHYKRPRTLSVREWARLQTFPDTFVFKGKRTTGGERRAGPDRDVPKYTQIGNAVPPFVAEGIGKIIINKILKN